MKRILWLFCIISISSSAQKLGLKAGWNNSELSGDAYSYFPSYHVGFFALFNLSENIKLSPELLYSRQGAKVRDGEIPIDYINLPILVNIYEYKWLFLQIGGQVGLVTSAGVYSNGVGTDIKSSLKPIDASLVGGFGFNFDRIIVNARYNWGIIDIVKPNPIAIIPRSDITTSTAIQVSLAVVIN